MGRSVGDDLLSAGLESAGGFVGEQETVLLGEEETGSDCVAAYAQLGHVHGIPLGEVVDGTLGCGICGDLRQGTESVHRRDVQHHALLSLDHVGREDHRGEQRALEVQVVDELESLHVEPVEALCEVGVGIHLLHGAGRLGRVASGAVDEDVYLAEFLVDEVPRLFEGGLVQGAGADAEALHAEFLRNLLALGGIVLAAADDCQVHPGFREAARQGHAQHAEAPGDDAVASFQVVE